MTLSGVTFGGTNGYHDVLQDANGVAYPPPHWTTNQSHPALYVSGSRMRTTSDYEVQLIGSFPTNIVVKGKASNGQEFLSTNAAGTASFTADASAILPANKVDFFNPLTIEWSYAVPGRTDWAGAGTSRNQVYVSLAAPTTTNLYHTVVHLACSNGHATTANDAVANTWALFSGPADVKTWDGIALTYYATSDGGNNTNTAGLLQNHDAQCSGFANLLMDSFKANGVTDARFTKVLPANGTIGFGVKNINFDDAYPAYPSEAYWKYSDADLYIDATGIPGQNTNTPAEKRFQNHWLVHRGTYYDPSYGKTTTGNTDFNSNIVAWKRDDGKWRKAEGSTYVVRFGVDVDESP